MLRTRRSRRDRTGLLIAIALVGIAVAAIKPWGAAMPAPSAAAAVEPSAVVAPPESSAPQPTAGPVIADRNAMACLTHQVEQVLTLERWPEREIKSWSQPSSGVVTISSSHVVGIGVCPGIGPAASTAPASPERDPLVWAGAVLTDVRLLDGGKGRDLGRPARITEQTDYVAAGVLYGAPQTQPTLNAPVQSTPAGPAWRQAPAAPLPAWPAGRYQISYFFPGDPDTRVRTVVVEIGTPLNGG